MPEKGRQTSFITPDGKVVPIAADIAEQKIIEEAEKQRLRNLDLAARIEEAVERAEDRRNQHSP